jgi:G3E family GTPase
MAQPELPISIHTHEHQHDALEHCHDNHPPHDHHHEHHHHHDITSLSFRFTESFDLEELEFRLMVFLQAQAKSIYRVKGIVNAQGEKKKSIVQSVSHYLSITEGQVWGQDEERMSRIVFIGKRLKPAGFEKMLRQCLFQGNQKTKDRILK